MYRNLTIDYLGEDPARWIGRGLTSAINTVRSAVAAIVAWHGRRITIRALMALDDHTLKDIGLRRGNVFSVVDERLKTSLGEPWVLAARRQAEAAAEGDTLNFVV